MGVREGGMGRETGGGEGQERDQVGEGERRGAREERRKSGKVEKERDERRRKNSREDNECYGTRGRRAIKKTVEREDVLISRNWRRRRMCERKEATRGKNRGF